MCASELVVDIFSAFYSGIENLFSLEYWVWRPGLRVQTSVLSFFFLFHIYQRKHPSAFGAVAFIHGQTSVRIMMDCRST